MSDWIINSRRFSVVATKYGSMFFFGNFSLAIFLTKFLLKEVFEEFYGISLFDILDHLNCEFLLLILLTICGFSADLDICNIFIKNKENNITFLEKPEINSICRLILRTF